MNLILLGIGIGCWLIWRGRRYAARKPTMPIAEARRLLEVPANADAEAIRAAHRRLIARVHPDAGGSAELARRVNAARDVLIAELNRNASRAS